MAQGAFFTAEEDAVILAIHERHAGEKGWRMEAASLLNRQPNAISNRLLILSTRKGFPSVASLSRNVRNDGARGVQVLAPLETDLEPEAQFLDRVRRVTSASVAHHKAEKYVRVRIESDRPIALSLSSDWHLSASGPTDVDGLLAYADAIRSTPGAYAVAVGDQTDNPIKHKPTATREIPDDLRLLDIVLGRFGNKLLGMTSGNHDDWTKAMVGVDNLQTMADRHRLHYAPDELIWLIEIVKPGTEDVTARWIIATRHKFRRHSNLNYTHACYRWLEENMNNWPHDDRGAVLLPDVVALGHNHVAEVSHRTTERGVVIAARMGSFQYTSGFTRAGGWALAPPTCPTVILPHIRDGSTQPHAYENYKDALAQIAPKDVLVSAPRVAPRSTSKKKKRSA